jgi:hypothetical protein
MAFLIDVHLDRHRHTAQRPRVLAPGDRRIDLPGSLNRLLGKLLHHGIDCGVHRGKPVEMGCSRAEAQPT